MTAADVLTVAVWITTGYDAIHRTLRIAADNAAALAILAGAGLIALAADQWQQRQRRRQRRRQQHRDTVRQLIELHEEAAQQDDDAARIDLDADARLLACRAIWPDALTWDDIRKENPKP
jgi:hypothetical protein